MVAEDNSEMFKPIIGDLLAPPIGPQNTVVEDVEYCFLLSKIEKVPRGIRGEKSSKDMASSRDLVSTIEA